MSKDQENSSVAGWLEELGLNKYIELFIDNEIDWEILPELTDQDLKELDLPLGPRKKLLKAINALTDSLNETVGDAQPFSATAAGQPTAMAMHSEAERRSDAERRQLTVMFCDLVGSTNLSNQFDPEDLRDIIGSFQSCCEIIIQRFGGFVARYMGDGLLVYFGYPYAQEYDAERAVKAGLELVSAVQALTPRPNLKLQTRVGIATGEVIIGDLISQNAAEERAVVGRTPNLAAYLQGLAEPDTVLISDTTRRLIGGLFDYVDLDDHRLQDFDHPTQAWQVLAESYIESRFEATHGATQLTPLVGRDEEIEWLQQRWQQAQTGQGQIVLLVGEAGIGKSRLIETLREQVVQKQHPILRYFCSPHHQNSTLYPIIQQIERVAHIAHNDSAQLKLDKLERLIQPNIQSDSDFTETMRLFAALLSIPSEGRYAPLELSPQRLKERKLQALFDQLVALTSQQPALMIFEDLHWIDPTTLEWLEMIITRVPNLRLFIVMTARPEFTHAWHGLAQISMIELNRLNANNSTEIINRLTGGKTLPAELMQQIILKTDGIPLFVEDLTKTVLESGILQEQDECYVLDGSLPPLAVPSTLHDSLIARLDRLAAIKEIAQLGAVIGRQFSYPLIAAVAHLNDVALSSALTQLVDAELLYRRGIPPNATYTFKHALLQDAAYNSLLNNRRQFLHANIVKILEQQFSEIVVTKPELLAHHYTGAGLHHQAIEYWNKAARHAIRQSAYREAIAHVNKGLDLLAKIPDDQEREYRELDLQTARATIYQATKGFAAAETGEAYRRAHELCARVNDAEKVFPVLHGVYLFHMLVPEIDATYKVACECLQQVHGHENSLLAVIAQRIMGAVLFVRGDFPAARDYLAKALELYHEQRDQAAVLTYGVDQKSIGLAHSAQVLFALGYPDQALDCMEQAIVYAERLKHSYNLGYTLFWSNVMGIQRGAAERVSERAKRLAALGQEHGFPTWAAYGTFQSGAALAQLGHFDRAIALMQQGLASYLALGSDLFRPNKLATLAQALAQTGQTQKALELLNEALAIVDKTEENWFSAELYRCKAHLLSQQDLSETNTEAENCLLRALEIARQQQAKLWELRAANDLARLWCKQNKQAQARTLLTPVYQWFEEGFDLSELKQAGALMEELNALRS